VKCRGSPCIEILSSHGRRKEAAWDFMEAGFPEKAVREYGEILDHEKVLAMCYYAGLYNELIVHMKRLVFHSHVRYTLANYYLQPPLGHKSKLPQTVHTALLFVNEPEEV